MSYILDALKKAEQERQRGSVPDLLTIQAAPAERPRNSMPRRYFLLLLFIVGTVVSVWGLSRLISDKAYVPSADTYRPDAHRIPSPPLVMSSAEGTGGDKREGVVSGVNQNSAAKTQVLPDKEAHRAPETIRERSTGGPVIIVPDKTNELPRNSGPKQAAVQNHNQPEARAEKSAPEQQPSPDKIYSLKDLPESVKKDLPEFSISAFLYSESPASRMVRVNDRMLHEGQELVPGLRLQEITSDGVVFLHKGFRFSITMKRGA